MPTDLILPTPGQNGNGKKLYTIPVPEQLKAKAGLIIQSAGLNYIKQKILFVDQNKMAQEQAANQPADQSPYGYDKQNAFGPIFDVLTLKALSYTDFNGQVVNLGDFTLDIALIDAEQPREIVTTPVTGRDGHVHEYMSDGDWDIKISGVLINPLANIPPETLVRALHQFCKAKKEIEVTSGLLSYLEVYSMIIVKPRFKQREGARNAIDYELYCLSDTPFELK